MGNICMFFKNIIGGSMERHYKFEVYEDKKKEWRFRIVASNGRIIADSGEGYHNKKDCLENIESIETCIKEGRMVLDVKEKK
jgi:uncharacterized protein YegP (UPF0339 family)